MSGGRVPKVVVGGAGKGTGNKRTYQFLVAIGAIILSFGLVLWSGATVFAPKVPPQGVETHTVSQQPNPASDYQQRLDLYYQRRAETERQRQTPTGGYLSGATSASGEWGGDPIRQAIIR